jgi:hypothetical protein
MIESAIEVKVSRKDSVERIPVKHPETGKVTYVPKFMLNGSPKLIALSDMKVFGLYNVCRGLIDRGKLLRYNANGTLKDDRGGGSVYIDYDEFNKIREF